MIPINKFKTIIFVLTIFSVLPIISAVSEDNFYNTGSDFYIIQNNQLSPLIITLYESTQIYIDINDDGIYDYDYGLKLGENRLNPPWPVEEGTRVHTNKPVAYLQELQYDKSIVYFPTTYAYKNIKTAVPPINNYKNRYLLRSGTWSIITTGFNKTQNIHVDADFDNLPDMTYNITKKGTITLNSYAVVYSDKNFLAHNSETIGAIEGVSFNNMHKEARVLLTKPTRLAIDYNLDNSIDRYYNYGPGEYLISNNTPFRITSDNPISCYAVHTPKPYNTHTFALLPSDMITNEALLYSNGYYFSPTQNTNYPESSALVVFDRHSGFSDFTQLDLMNIDGTISKHSLETNYSHILPNGVWHANASMPLIFFIEKGESSTYYSLMSTLNYQPYKQIYISTYQREKVIDKNSPFTISAAVFNPFKGVVAKNVNVRIKYDAAFSLVPTLQKASFQKLSLKDGSDGGNSGSVDLIPLLIGDSYQVTIPLGELGEEEYFIIDFILISPNAYGQFKFEESELSFEAPTWKT